MARIADLYVAHRGLTAATVGGTGHTQACQAFDQAVAATATAERNGREPLAYLTGYLQACATAGGKAPEGEALQRFLPWVIDPGDTTGSHGHDSPAIIQSGPSPS
ncbi:hypothetical protein [Frankia sp. Cr2]|uniref:hypothetical protein n=1 Tax=Frankia sp. Cr2 TaxID=3073932 RepID=UPI002AD2F21C|nr:hypothetical protein [Frankia sp. Cr2]